MNAGLTARGLYLPPIDDAGSRRGTWTVGIAMTGNFCGRSEAGLSLLSTSERAQLRADATPKLRAAGAHAVIVSVADLLPALYRLHLTPGHPSRSRARNCCATNTPPGTSILSASLV